MRRYETIFILDPEIPDDVCATLTARAQNQITQDQGLLIKHEDWGLRKMAYPVRKKIRGHYVLMEYCGVETTVSEIERAFRIDDRIIKFMTVLLDPEPDLAAIQELMAQASEAAAGTPPTAKDSDTPETDTAEAVEETDDNDNADSEADTDTEED